MHAPTRKRARATMRGAQRPGAVQHGTERAALTSSPTPLSQPSPCSLSSSPSSLLSPLSTIVDATTAASTPPSSFLLSTPLSLALYLSLSSLLSFVVALRHWHPLRAPLLALAISVVSLHSVPHHRPPPPSSPNTTSITHLPGVSLPPSPSQSSAPLSHFSPSFPLLSSSLLLRLFDHRSHPSTGSSIVTQIRCLSLFSFFRSSNGPDLTAVSPFSSTFPSTALSFLR